MPETPPEMQPHLGIGHVAERTGLSVHALRFYEREGLSATPVHCGPGGRRLYSDWDLEWLDVCVKLRASGMPLSAIRRYAALVRAGAGNEDDRLSLLRQHQVHVRGHIAALTECLDLITFKVQLYETRPADGSTDPLFIPQSPSRAADTRVDPCSGTSACTNSTSSGFPFVSRRGWRRGPST